MEESDSELSELESIPLSDDSEASFPPSKYNEVVDVLKCKVWPGETAGGELNLRVQRIDLFSEHSRSFHVTRRIEIDCLGY